MKTGEPQNREHVLDQLRQITSELLRMLSTLTPETLNTAPFAGSWTPAQLGQHLWKSYGVIEIMRGRTTATRRPVVEDRFLELEDAFLNFDIRMESPDFIHPSEGWIDRDALLIGLQERISETITFAEENDLSLTCLDFELPEYGKLTRLEWIRFFTVHTRRHVHQLKSMVESLRTNEMFN